VVKGAPLSIENTNRIRVGLICAWPSQFTVLPEFLIFDIISLSICRSSKRQYRSRPRNRKRNRNRNVVDIETQLILNILDTGPERPEALTSLQFFLS
jgi:hypothetical protein